MTFALGLVIGGSVGCVVMAFVCIPKEPEIDRVAIWMSGWRSCYRAMLHMDDVQPDPEYRSVETLEAERLINETRKP